jgi:hypothetical protein
MSRIPSQSIRPRYTRSIMMLGFAAFAATACRPAVRTVPEPSVSALVVNNASQFDMNVYAMPNADGKPVWLATVPAAQRITLPVNRQSLRSDGTLVVRTQAIGSSHAWTSGSVAINDNVVALLDLVVNRAGNSGESRLFTADARDVAAVIY